MRHVALSATAASILSMPALGTVSNLLAGDSYIVKSGVGDSARFYSVLDVFIRCGASADSLGGTFGVSSYVASYTMNQGDAFVQQDGTQSNRDWLPAAGHASYDSFITAGNRDQTSAASTLNITLDTNWAAGDGTAITALPGSTGPGWYPGVGANTNINPYARAGYYNGLGNVARTDRTIAGNIILPGGSLDNMWMIGRFTIDITGLSDTATRNMTLKFASAGKNNGVTTETGATGGNFRWHQTLTFAVPAPGAIATVALAGLIRRRRS